MLRPVLGSVLKGYNKSKFAGKTVYYKHLSLIDFCDIQSIYQEYYDRAVEEGILNEESKVKLMIESGEWSIEKENEIKYLKEQIRMDKEAKSKMAIPSQVRARQKEIEIQEKKLSDLNWKRRIMTGMTAEDFAIKKNNEYYVYRSSYKDTKCKDPLFSDEDFDDLSDKEIESLIGDYNKSFSSLDMKNIQRLAFSLYFQDTFKIAGDNPYYFFGKFTQDLSRFQIELFFEGRRFINMIQSQEHPTEDILSDPDKLIEWFDTTKNASNLVKNSDGNVSLVGATKQDIKELGLDTGEKSLVEILRSRDPKKKVFSMADAVRIGGQT